MNKLLTIGIPVYNTEAYLNRCLESVLFPESADRIEIVLVNDGSTDNSLSVARAWQKRFPDSVRIIDKPNGGHGSAVNRAVKAAQGRYFKLLDSDDWLDRPNFPKYLTVLEKTEADVIVTRMIGEHTYVGWQDFDRKRTNVVYNTVSDIEETELVPFLPMGGITYRTEMLQKNYIDLQEKTFYVDNEYILYPMLQAETILFSDMFLYHYFIGRPEQSINLTSRLKNLEHIRRIAERMAETVRPKHLSPVKKKYFFTIAYDMAKNYIGMTLKYRNGKTIAERHKHIREFTISIKKTNPELQNELYKYAPYRFYRFLPSATLYLMPFLEKYRKLIFSKN